MNMETQEVGSSVPIPDRGVAGCGVSGDRSSGQQVTGRSGRQNPKEKITGLQQQLRELEDELATVTKDCEDLDQENQALLKLAQNKEAEAERERAIVVRAIPQPNQQSVGAGAPSQSTPGVADAHQAGTGSIPGASSSGRQQAGGSATEPTFIITSCPGCTFTVTRPMLDGSPRLELERIYNALLQHMQSIVMQYRETENQLKTALLSGPDLSSAAGAGSTAALEANLAGQIASLRGPIADLLRLYIAAFRADASQTDSMARRLVHNISSVHGTQSADKALLRLNDELTRSLAQTIKRFLSIATDCMERRKQLQANLRQPSDALLEWEAVAQWLRNDAVIGELQRVLAREADAYLDWAQHVCTKVWPPMQAAQILLAYPPAELFQLACRVLAHAAPATAAQASGPASGPHATTQPPIAAQQMLPHTSLPSPHTYM